MPIQSKLHSFLASARKALSKNVSDRGDPGQISADLSSVTEDELQAESHDKSSPLIHAAGYRGQNGVQLLTANAEYSRTLETPGIGIMDDLDQTPAADVMSLASRSRAAHYARKHAALARIFQREADLKTAKGQVLEYEEELQRLRKEVEVADESLTKIETEMANLEHLLVQTHPGLDITASVSRDSLRSAGSSSPVEPS